MSAEIMFLVAVVIAAAVGGFWLSHHIHQVANAAARAVTVPQGAVDKLNAALPGAGTAVQSASNAAASSVSGTIDKAAG